MPWPMRSLLQSSRNSLVRELCSSHAACCFMSLAQLCVYIVDWAEPARHRDSLVLAQPPPWLPHQAEQACKQQSRSSLPQRMGTDNDAVHQTLGRNHPSQPRVNALSRAEAPIQRAPPKPALRPLPSGPPEQLQVQRVIQRMQKKDPYRIFAEVPSEEMVRAF